MLLDIIVPHYNESWAVVRPFFDVINSQKGIDFNDFRVILVHDGVDPFPDSYLDGPAKVIQLWQPKSGVSAARNLGIDYSNAKWINFSDCDDCFASIFSLHMLLHVLKNDEYSYDLLWSPFYMIEGTSLTRFDTFNRVFIHNKYYRLETLRKIGARFNEELFMSEDSAFNTVVMMALKEGSIGQINVTDPLYAWCRRNGSITMNPERWFEISEGHYNRNRYMIEEYRRHADKEHVEIMTLRTMADLYSMISRPGMKGDPTHVKEEARKFYLENKELIDRRLENEHYMTILNFSCDEMGNPNKSEEAFSEWLSNLMTTENDKA